MYFLTPILIEPYDDFKNSVSYYKFKASDYSITSNTLTLQIPLSQNSFINILFEIISGYTGIAIVTVISKHYALLQDSEITAVSFSENYMAGTKFTFNSNPIRIIRGYIIR